MKKNILSIASLFIGFLGYSQTEVYFKYDEAGNQRYRGTNSNAKQASNKLLATENKVTAVDSKVLKTSNVTVMEEKAFWKQIRLYPIPVNDFITIDWTEEVDSLIESVSLYQHSTTHWKFQQQNLPNLNRQLKINMTGYEWGIYVLYVKLKDGRTFSRNITKR